MIERPAAPAPRFGNILPSLLELASTILVSTIKKSLRTRCSSIHPIRAEYFQDIGRRLIDTRARSAANTMADPTFAVIRRQFLLFLGYEVKVSFVQTSRDELADSADSASPIAARRSISSCLRHLRTRSPRGFRRDAATAPPDLSLPQLIENSELSCALRRVCGTKRNTQETSPESLATQAV